MAVLFDLLFLAGSICLIIYVAWIIWLVSQWRRPITHIRSSGKPGQHSPVATVVLAARNEAEGLPLLLESLISQRVHLPVVVVNDHSTDQTAEIISRFPGVTAIHLTEALKGKKAALTVGIKQAATPYILSTDADIILPATWTATLIEVLDGGAQLVTGPMLIAPSKGWLYHLQKWDALAFVGITAAGLKSGLYHMGNGSNIAFTRQAFEDIGGYQKHIHLPGGDDVFTIAAVAARHPGQVAYAQYPEAIVHTRHQNTWRALLQQRKRWGAKMAAMSQPWLWALVLSILSAQLVWFLFFVALWVKPVFAWFFFIYSLIKLVAEYVYLRELAKFAGVRLDVWDILWISPAHGLFMWITSLSALGPSAYQWKDRPYK